MIKNGFSPLRVQNWVYRLPYWKLICNNIYKEMVTLYHAFWTGASWLYMILQIHLVHVLYSHCLQGYQDSSWVVCKCFFNFTWCLFFYSHWLQGIMILCEFSLRDSSTSLFLCFFYSHWLVTGVSLFFASCLNVILQICFVCGYVFSLVTGVSQFFVSCL